MTDGEVFPIGGEGLKGERLKGIVVDLGFLQNKQGAAIPVSQVGFSEILPRGSGILPKCSEFSDSKKSMLNPKAKSVMAPALSSPSPGPYRTLCTWRQLWLRRYKGSEVY